MAEALPEVEAAPPDPPPQQPSPREASPEDLRTVAVVWKAPAAKAEPRLVLFSLNPVTCPT